MKKRNSLTLCSLISLFLVYSVNAQSDSMKLFDNGTPQKEYVEAIFKSTRVIMSHSLAMLKPGVLDFRILHRFGNLNSGFYEAFGLDHATIRLGLDYGLTKDLTLGIGRGSFDKEIDGFLKCRLLRQSTGPGSFPVTLIVVAGFTDIRDTTSKKNLPSGMGFYFQLPFGRKFSDAFSFQFTPAYIHRVSVLPTDPNDTYALGLGTRIKISHRSSINFDYYIVFNKNGTMATYNPLSIGFDIETGGHVFQLHLTNAIGMNERAFITQTTNRWSKGDIQFGFNISRSFQVKKKKF